MVGILFEVQERSSGADETCICGRRGHERGGAEAMMSIVLHTGGYYRIRTCQAKGRLLRFRSANKMAKIFQGLVGSMRVKDAVSFEDSIM